MQNFIITKWITSLFTPGKKPQSKLPILHPPQLLAIQHLPHNEVAQILEPSLFHLPPPSKPILLNLTKSSLWTITIIIDHQHHEDFNINKWLLFGIENGTVVFYLGGSWGADETGDGLSYRIWAIYLVCLEC